jgi:hypothetical protein
LQKRQERHQSVPLLDGRVGVNLSKAGPIKYVVSQTFYTGKVTGFIETDGKIGALTNTDVIGWNLLLSGGGSKADLTPLDSSASDGGGPLSATSSELLFDFKIAGDQGFCFSSYLGGYCWQDGEFGASLGVTRPFILMDLEVDHFSQRVVRFGVQVVGVHQAVAAIPEPASLGLLVAGLLGLGAFARRGRGGVA